MSISIKFYDRKLYIEQLSNILNQFDADMLNDLARSINDSKEAVEILRQLYVMNPSSKRVTILYELCGVTPFINKSSKKESTTKKTHGNEFFDSLQKVDNFKPSKSPSVLPGVAYKTNRQKRELCEITDVPSVNFDMPTVPDLPTLD